MKAFQNAIYTTQMPSLMAVDRENGQLYINPERWAAASPESKAFFLLHEQGHFDLNTANEVEADGYAFERYVGQSPEKVTQAMTALMNEIGNNHSTQAEERTNAMLRRAVEFYAQNGNEDAADLLYLLNSKSLSHSWLSDWTGIDIDLGGFVSDTFDNVTGTVSNLLDSDNGVVRSLTDQVGLTKPNTATQGASAQGTATQGSSNTTMYIIIGAAAFMMMMMMMMMMSRK